MARNIPVSYGYESRMNIMHVSVFENMDFEEIGKC